MHLTSTGRTPAVGKAIVGAIRARGQRTTGDVLKARKSISASGRSSRKRGEQLFNLQAQRRVVVARCG
jgi:hypothetical protein